MAPEQEKRWKLALRNRLWKALANLQGDVRLDDANAHHCEAFKAACENKIFKDKLSPLNPLEIELLSISSTAKQLEGASEYFAAEDVTDMFKFGISKGRRDEVQYWLQISRLGISSQDDETARVGDLLERIRHTLSPEGVTKLHQSLGAHLQQHPIGSSIVPPCNLPSLNHDAETILCIILAAGGSVPECFFGHAMSWDESGEAALVDVPVLDLLIDDQRRSKAVNEALRLCHLLQNEFLVIHPELVSRLRCSSEWKLAALQAVCKSFPRYPDQVLCASRCKAMLPTLATVLSYVSELKLDLQLRWAVFEVCISASYFGLLPWKQQMLDYANQIHGGDLLSTQRLQLRTKMLKRLSSSSAEPVHLNAGTPRPNNPRENGYLGEEVVFELKLLRDRGYSPHLMMEYFARYKPFGPTPSTQERRVTMAGRGIIARAFKNQGNWTTSAELYNAILADNQRASLSPGHDVLASLSEVYCELRDPDRALRILSSEVGFFRDAGAKLQLATANASLMQALILFCESGQLHEDALAEAETLYYRYQSPWVNRNPAHFSIVNKTNYYVACAGTAMTRHLLSFFHQKDSAPWELVRKMERADAAWEATKDSARWCWPTPSYAHMITIYSQCELAYRLGKRDIACKLRDEAEIIFRRTGREYYFVAQGTIWLEILRKQALQNDWVPID